jgi:hypothetical protein
LSVNGELPRRGSWSRSIKELETEQQKYKLDKFQKIQNKIREMNYIIKK